MDSTLAADPSADTFVPADVLGQAATLNKAQADLCGFGIVKVDDAGRVLLSNRYQSEMSGQSAASATGRNFFTQVNPCTNNPIFFGLFKQGVADNALDATFDYVFTYQMRPTAVRVQLYRDAASQTNWVFIKKA